MRSPGPPDARDPYCPAYRATFDHIQSRLLAEMASEENIAAIAERPWDGRGNPLLRKGLLIELAREGPHPSHIARTAKRIVAAVELARGPDLDAVAARLVTMGLCRTQQSALASLDALQRRLHPETTPRNNLYLHVTFACQLHCTHCYARAAPLPPLPLGEGRVRDAEMAPAALQNLIREAKEAAFRQVVITGGEPLVHSQRDAMLDMLAEARRWAAPMNLVLRTNFALPLTPDDLRRIAAAFDQVVVSVDGSEATHDARRGAGSYAAALRNLEEYQRICHRDTEHTENPSALRPLCLCGQFPAELSLACVMRAADNQGEAGHAVRALAARLGIRRTRFRTLLPLGRAADWDEPPTSEALGAHADPMDLIESGFHPVASCGLGQNLYVEPSGQAFPCYAYHQPHSFLGNTIEAGLRPGLESDSFRDLARHTVDTNPKCRSCDLRYLCGGACRAWCGEAAQHNLNGPPPECEGLKQRAAGLLNAARRELGTFLRSGMEYYPCSRT